MHGRKGQWRRGLAALTMAVAMVPMLGGSAHAISPLPIVCTAAGTVNYVDSIGVDSWTLAGKGSCQGDLGGTYFLDFTGSGTSDALGLCDASIVVRNLDITILGTLTSFQGPSSVLRQHWVAPVTTYPFVTPFRIEGPGGGSIIGAGNFFNHIFLRCAGSPVAQFEFAFLT